MAKISSYTQMPEASVNDTDTVLGVDPSAGTSGTRQFPIAALRSALARLGLNPPTVGKFAINGTTQWNYDDGAIFPETDDDVDLGKSSQKFKDGYFDGAVYADDLVVATKTPSSASDTGVTGTIAWDASYIYICTATDTWKRVAIATW